MNIAENCTDDLLRKIFCRILGCHKPEPEPPPVAEWTMVIGATVINFTGAWKMNLKDDSNAVPISVANWVDSKGKKAKVDPNTPVVFTSSDDNLVAIGTSAAGGPAIIVGPMTGVDADDAGVIGAVTITATADADLGEGTKAVNAAGAVTLLSGDAATGEITFGTPDA